MARLNIEWRHYDKDGKTCERCGATGNALKNVAESLAELKDLGIEVTITETLLTEADLAQSNIIFFNGIPLEELLQDAEVIETSCTGCSCLTGKDVSCRAIEYDGKSFDAVPESLILAAALKAIDVTAA